MESSRFAIWALGILFCIMMSGENGGVSCSGSRTICGFPALFNFGDSNSDTGTNAAAMGGVDLPNGMSFRNDSKRVSDGRLIIDYMADDLGLPYLDSPLDAFGTSFKHGANFATAGAKISPIVIYGMIPPTHLDVQVSQFLQFKTHTIALSKQFTKINSGNHPPLENKFPEPEVFSKALYTFDIGQNDVTGGFYNSSIPVVIDEFSNSLQRLLRNGAKYFWVHNTGPVGCLPVSIGNCPSNKTECLKDESGCVKRMNEQSQEFNKQLEEMIYKLRAQYPDAAFTYVDIYSAKYSLIINAKNLGFHDPLGFCCGKDQYWCGQKGLNGTLLGTACNDPSKYINWDTVHYTQAANQFVAKLIINGSLSDPPTPIAEACQKP